MVCSGVQRNLFGSVLIKIKKHKDNFASHPLYRMKMWLPQIQPPFFYFEVYWFEYCLRVKSK